MNKGKAINAAYIAKMLSSETVLMAIHLRKWGGTKADTSSAKIVAGQYGGDKDGWGNAQMKLLPAEYRSELAKRGQAVGTVLKQRGIPFMGGYLIRVQDYAEVRAATDKELAELQLCIEGIITDLPRIEQYAKGVFGDKHYDGLIPTGDTIRASFQHRISVTSQELPSTLEADERARLMEDATGALSEALQDQVELIKELVAKFTEAVNDTLSGKQKKFTASSHWGKIEAQADKLRSYADAIPGLNEALDGVELLMSITKSIGSADIKDSALKADSLKAGLSGMEKLLADF